MKSLIHACKCLLRIDSPRSQVTEDELRCLLRHSSKAEVLVELGCYEGKTSAALASNCEGMVFSIDPFFRGRLGVCWGQVIAKNYSRRKNLRNLCYLKGLSHEAVRSFNKSVAFLFIDADHSYESVKKDWDDWFPKVQAGGIIALHDSRIAPNSPTYIGSMKFFEEYVLQSKEVEEIDGVDSLVVLRKVG